MVAAAEAKERRGLPIEVRIDELAGRAVAQRHGFSRFRFDQLDVNPFRRREMHARLVLEHLPERDRVLAKLAGAVRPGGWLLVEDFDWSTAMVVDPPSELHSS